MVRKTAWLIALSVITLSLAACNQGGPKTVTVTAQDSQSTVKLNKGDTLEVILVGNPSTGFQWEPASFDTTVLQQVGEPEFKPNSSAIGSIGKVTLRFEAVGSGNVNLQLIYHRTFEADAPSAQTFELTLEVK